MNDNQLDNHHGGCLCGKVRYSISNEPFAVVVCMCHFCQKMTGSDYLTLSVFKKPEFKLDQGKPGVYEHISEGSGHKIFIHFCRDCGTTLFHYFERFGESIGVFSGTFDDPNWIERSPETVEYIFLESAPRGAMVPAGYKTYPGHCLNLDGELLEPTYFEKHEIISVDER